MIFTNSLATLAWFLIFFGLATCCCGGIALTKEKNWILSICYLIGAGISVVLTIMLVVRAPKAVDEKHAQIQKMESYEAINGCSDKYVNLPTHLADQVLASAD